MSDNDLTLTRAGKLKLKILASMKSESSQGQPDSLLLGEYSREIVKQAKEQATRETTERIISIIKEHGTCQEYHRDGEYTCLDEVIEKLKQLRDKE